MWGIIGCGDVAEVKSGPAFQKIANSELLAVMRRNANKAKDFAERHQVPFWYDSVENLLENPEINTVYIATPPSSHLEITLKAIEAEKHVYLEKPMALSAEEAETILKALEKSTTKLTVAHYRRKLPAFLKVGELLERQVIGQIRFAEIKILQPPKSSLIADSEDNWRIKPSISGGGYFHDLAPHQLDLMISFFGEINDFRGFSSNQQNLYKADDIINGIISFKSGVQFSGLWCFNISEKDKKDQCIIYGSKGSISFSFFGDKVSINSQTGKEVLHFDTIPHIQQPMIQAAVEYFLGKANNPCSAEDGLSVMKVIDRFCNKF